MRDIAHIPSFKYTHFNLDSLKECFFLTTTNNKNQLMKKRLVETREQICICFKHRMHPPGLFVAA